MELQAPSSWRCIDFISDLHLQASDKQTFKAWENYLQHTVADAVFILGDLFEVWVGDDCLSNPSGFESQCVQAMRLSAQRLDLYIMQGNRDFLMGASLMQEAHASALEDPCVLTFAGERWLLSHGDALCLEDTDYQQFRAVVRSASWQQDFLAQSLENRQEIARGLRNQSEALKRSVTTYADVDTDAAIKLLTHSNARHMVHGHTHRPATHALADGMQRIVLSDWDLAAQAPRAEVLRLNHSGGSPAWSLVRLPVISASSSPRD